MLDRIPTITRQLLTRGARLLAAGVAGMILVLAVGFVVYLQRLPDLDVWHTAELDAEFTADSDVTSFAEYLALEDRLFAQVDRHVYARVPSDPSQRFLRYERGSRSDPAIWPRDWNRSFELPAPAARGGVLLLHGLSDSPYSLRHVAETFHGAGFHVLGLRLPGHGTAPAGLLDVSWRDWARAVRIAARHLRTDVGDAPIYFVGYSNGGALSVEYAIASLTDDTLPRAAGLILLSPEIGITRAAALAIWQERIAGWLGIDKLRWSSVNPEYDPFKYQSFAVNAGDQAYRITREIDRRLGALHATGELATFPPVLVFQSIVDATVQAPALISVLMQRLPENGSEVVIFDANRTSDLQFFLEDDDRPEIDALLGGAPLAFTLTLVTNADPGTRDVVARTRRAGENGTTDTALGTAWPAAVFSLTHVALPFPPTDALYGGEAPVGRTIPIGHLVLHGEKGVFRISAADMLRIRWNPFYSYLEARIRRFIGLD